MSVLVGPAKGIHGTGEIARLGEHFGELERAGAWGR